MDLVSLIDGGRQVATIYREEARILKKTGQIVFANHGRDAHVVRPAREVEDDGQQTLIEKIAGWNISREMRHCALSRGAAGQNVVHYPIPYAFEGYMEEMRAAIVNAPKPKDIQEKFAG